MFDLYKGATRPATMFGVPTNALLGAFVAVGVLSVSISIFMWVVFPVVIFVMAMIAKKDDRAFRQWGLFIDTKFRCPRVVKNFWGATSYTPIKNKKWQKWSKKEIKK